MFPQKMIKTGAGVPEKNQDPVFQNDRPGVSKWQNSNRCSKNVKKDTNNIYQGISSNQKLLQTEINYQELFPLSFVY